ncbi:MAG: hypothetical protein MZV65_39000 [Chromatiales bacterium]|nr:hypothetical protein [Chromatiales bacterium]
MSRSNLPAVTSQIPRDLRLFIDRVREVLPAAANQTDLAAQQKSVAALTRQAAQLSATLSTATAKIDGSVAALAATVAAEDAKLAGQVKAVRADLTTELLGVRTRVSALEAAAQSHAQLLVALNEAQTTTDQSLDGLRADLDALDTRLEAAEALLAQPPVIAGADTDTGVMPEVTLTLPAGDIAVQVTATANVSPAEDATAVGGRLTCAFNGTTSPAATVSQAGEASMVLSLSWVFVDTIETAGDYSVSATLADLTANTHVGVTAITAVATGR